MNIAVPEIESTEERTLRSREQLLKEMKRTAGSRFNAAKRLEYQDRRRTSNMAYASASVIVITLLPAFFGVPAWISNAIALTTVAMSLLILAYTLLQAYSGVAVKADQFHRCALEINSLRRKLRSQTAEINPNTLEKFAVDYDYILMRYNLNHDDIDYEKYRYEHPDEFSVFWKDIDRKREARRIKKQAALSHIGGYIIAVTMAISAATLASAANISIDVLLQQLQELLHRLE